MRIWKVCAAFLWITTSIVFAQQLPSNKAEFKWLQWDAEHLRSLDSGDAVGVTRGLTIAERQELIRSFETALRPSVKELSLSSKEELHKAVVENTRIEKLDLNGDGAAEVIVQGVGEVWGCSPTGNCPLWILLKTPSGYKTIVDSVGQSFSVMKTRTNGFRDLVVGMHGSATSQELKLYSYKNGRYVKAGCYEAGWAVLVNGEMQALEQPVIKKCES